MKEKRNTLQKRIVNDVFCEMHNHPSAGMVYDAVLERAPGISRATVYRLLAEAADEGKVQRLKFTDGNDRFDITTEKHFHVVCKHCGSVADVKTCVDLIAITDKTEGCENFSIDDCNLEFVGVCERCQNKI